MRDDNLPSWKASFMPSKNILLLLFRLCWYTPSQRLETGALKSAGSGAVAESELDLLVYATHKPVTDSSPEETGQLWCHNSHAPRITLLAGPIEIMQGGNAPSVASSAKRRAPTAITPSTCGDTPIMIARLRR